MTTLEPGIQTLADLRNHLQHAIVLELTTIPPYLCALYSIKPGANSAARETIQSVVLEEMLHMALAANVLNAIGGTPNPCPVAGGPSLVPDYPAQVPYIAGLPEIDLQAFSPEALKIFIDIEHPTTHRASNPDKQYASIGAFYAAIKAALNNKDLCPPELFEAARHERRHCQVRSGDYYGGAGALIEVSDRDSALDALTLIATEGEGLPRKALSYTADKDLASANKVRQAALGFDSLGDTGVVDLDELPNGWKMYSHYARFKEICHGRRYFPEQLVKQTPRGDFLPTDWDAVRRMPKNPKAKDYKGTWAYKPMMACNETYTALVKKTYCDFTGEADGLRDAVGLMYELKYQAEALFNMQSPREGEEGWTLGPAFEYLGNQNDPSATPARGQRPSARRRSEGAPARPNRQRSTR
jgi:hypothetical protein